MTAKETIEILSDLIICNSQECETDDVCFFPGLDRVVACGDKGILILNFDDGSTVCIMAEDA